MVLIVIIQTPSTDSRFTFLWRFSTHQNYQNYFERTHNFFSHRELVSHSQEQSLDKMQHCFKTSLTIGLFVNTWKVMA